ncbi:MAG: YHS domain-containing protein [Pseudomonadales bacterium]
MDKLEFTIHCPVCHMTITNRSLLLNYKGVDHYFCSSQCLARFKSHPHLFVGDPQHGMSPKQKNKVVQKKRRIRLREAIGDQLKADLKISLKSLMGIEQLDFTDQELYVTYDLLQISLEDIEQTIEQEAGRLREGMVEQVKSGLIHYSEDCELDNLAHLTKDGGYNL